MIETNNTCDIASCISICKGLHSFWVLSYVQTDATTPNIGRPIMLGVVASVLAVVCKRDATTPDNVWTCSPSWEGYNPYDFLMRVRGPNMLKELYKRIQHCFATLRWSRNKTRLDILAKKFHLFQNWRNNSQQHATTCNRVCKRTQLVTSTNVASCWPKMLHPLMFHWALMYLFLFKVCSSLQENFYFVTAGIAENIYIICKTIQ